MNDYLTNIDNIFNTFLQKNIQFVLNNQIIKEGKFILYNHGYFTYIFNIKNSKKNKLDTLKLPIPFNIEFYASENLLYFDYRIKSFIHGNKELDFIIKNIKKPYISKYYDKILTIEEVK